MIVCPACGGCGVSGETDENGDPLGTCFECLGSGEIEDEFMTAAEA